MKFVDEVSIRVYGGNGGNGHVGWRKEKYVPRGGPDGGDGGNGGSVIFKTAGSLNTLIDFSFNPEVRAEHAVNGGNNSCTGRDGRDTLRLVPVGTQVYYQDRLVADLCQTESYWIAARGGHGGKGNKFFKSATNQSPDYAQTGIPGEIREFRLVLKSVADVGLVGLPNVGKSTLVSRVSKAHPKIADYPFTTLRPSLGVVLVGEEQRLVIADIPGLIPGAHQGKGLGIKFLRHIERTSVLAQLIDVSASAQDQDLDMGDIAALAVSQFDALDQELLSFSPELAARPRIVIFSKADLPQSREAYSQSQEFFADKGLKTVLISSETGEGLDLLKQELMELVHKSNQLPGN